MQKEIFNIQLTKEEIENLIQVLEDRINEDIHNEHPAQKLDINLKNYFNKIIENKILEDESPF